MATTTDTHSGIASTITALEAELPQLEEKQQELAKDLAAVTQRLEAVRTAAASLKAIHGVVVPLPDPSRALPAETAAAAPVAQPEPAVEEPTASAAPESVPAQRHLSSEQARGTKPSRDAGKPGNAPAPAPKKVKAKQSDVRAARKADATDKQPETAQVKRTRTPGLSKSIVAILGQSKKPLRAGEVNELLGREKTDGSVNSVRTALERLVANRDIQRVGRGLYQAV